MTKPISLDDFLEAQGKGITATLEACADKSTHIKLTPWHGEGRCGCSSSIELPREAIASIVPTGKFVFCCGKRLEVAVVELNDKATISIGDLLKQKEQPMPHGPGEPGHRVGHGHGGGYSALHGPAMPPSVPQTGRRAASSMGLIGRWRLPWTRCTVSCIEVCTRFCSDTGWDCCEWETRCAIDDCAGPIFDPFG
jgi:hypothetical protein